MLHLMVVEKALGRLLLVKAAVLHSSTVEVPARLANVDDVLFTNIAFVFVADVVFVAQCASIGQTGHLGLLH